MRFKDIFESVLLEAKNTHMTHLEDLIFDEGVDGTRRAINFLRDLRDMLAGNSDKKLDVTVKWDGCVHEDTILLTNKGDKTIKEVIIDDDITSVLACNLEAGVDLYVPIIGKNVSEPKKEWVEIQLANGSILKLTEDHEVHTSNRGWIKACDLTTGDDITEYSSL